MSLPYGSVVRTDVQNFSAPFVPFVNFDKWDHRTYINTSGHTVQNRLIIGDESVYHCDNFVQPYVYCTMSVPGISLDAFVDHMAKPHIDHNRFSHVIISVGSHDLKRSSYPVLLTKYGKLIERLPVVFPNSFIFLSELFRRKEIKDTYVSQLNADITDIASVCNIRIIPTFNAITLSMFKSDNKRLNYSGFHQLSKLFHEACEESLTPSLPY